MKQVAEGFFGLTDDVPKAPKHIRQDLKALWQDEYSAYRTELSIAHQ
jgi:hypothetical protein